MAEVTSEMVKTLRERTSAGMMDCKKALAESGGDMEKAIDVLRKKGLKDVSKRAGRVAREGTVLSYIHGNGRIGVMVELNCETDFVARNEDFTALAQAIAMHIAWANPRYLERAEVPAADLEREKDIYRSQLKPGQEAMAEKILAGKLEKFYADNCLVEQLDARNPDAKKTLADLIQDVSAKLGEKLVLRRFIRFELGEGIEKQESDFAAEVAAVAGVGA